MKQIEFKKLLKENKPQHIIRLYINDMANLTDKQLGRVIELKNKKEVRGTK